MESLTNRMRALAIQDLKERRELIFQKTRKLIECHEDIEEDEPETLLEKHHFPEEMDELDRMREMERMEQEARAKKRGGKHKNKNTSNEHRVRRYWSRLLQVSDWMVAVPQNLGEFYVGARPEGAKCLVVFTGNTMELCDKSGGVVASFDGLTKLYNGTILQAFYSEETRQLVISDMIAWKSNPMTSSEFQFRYSWVISNLKLGILKQSTGGDVRFIEFETCCLDSLEKAYVGETPYRKDGLLFVHKHSPYDHGLNHNVLIWKDANVSQYFEQECQDNETLSHGVGYINKEGQVRTLENVGLFALDRATFDANHRFVKFVYSDLVIINTQEQKVEVKLVNSQVRETCRNHNGPADSLGKLFYKCNLKRGAIGIEKLVQALRCKKRGKMNDD